MKIKFTISSRILGFDKTYPVVITSLLESGIDPNDIYFVIGGHDVYSQEINEDGINIIKSTQNSIDYTGLISVIEQNIYSDYWVLLHDTCYVGSNFYKTIKEYDYKNKPAVALSNDLSMNIGAYSWQYLENIKSDLMQFRNTDFSESSIQHWKQIGILNEDRYLLQFRTQYHYTDIPRTSTGPVDLYLTGVPRMIEYFGGIDLYKVKANWYNKNNYELKV